MTAQHPVMGAAWHFIQIAQQHDVGHGSGQVRTQHKSLVALSDLPFWMPSQRPLQGHTAGSGAGKMMQQRLQCPLSVLLWNMPQGDTLTLQGCVPAVS